MDRPLQSALPKNDLTARVTLENKDRSRTARALILIKRSDSGHRECRLDCAGSFIQGGIRALGVSCYDCVVAAAAAALARFRSSCGLGRFLPYVPRKILPRFDRLSPLPIG
jgi:hypothetical protein